MAGNQPAPLNVSDMAGISEAIITLVSKYPELPFKATASNVIWQDMGSGECIGMYTLQGAVYVKKYLRGSFVGQMPFQIIYQTSPTSNKGRIDSQKMVEGLARWLTECTADFKDKSLEIEKIDMTSPVIKLVAENSGKEAYTCNMTVRYLQK